MDKWKESTKFHPLLKTMNNYKDLMLLLFKNCFVEINQILGQEFLVVKTNMIISFKN